MTLNIKTLFATISLASALVLVGCGQEETPKEQAVVSKTIKVGVIAGAEAQVAEVAANIAEEKYGLSVELVTFTDYVTPNAALEDGSIDVNAFQHKPYLDQQIESRGYKFESVGQTFVYPIAAYSKKIKTIEELEDGARIAIPNDPTNLGRSLLLLQQKGLLTLTEGADVTATVRDITDNPKNIDIVELDAAQLPRSLDDVDLAIINNTFASTINLSSDKDGIIVEDKESPYTNLIVARQDNAQADNVKTFVKAYQTEEVYNAAFEIFDGSVVKGW